MLPLFPHRAKRPALQPFLARSLSWNIQNRNLWTLLLARLLVEPSAEHNLPVRSCALSTSCIYPWPACHDLSRTGKRPASISSQKSVMKWVALGLLLSSAGVVVISILSDMKFSELTKLGYLTFALAAGASASRLLVPLPIDSSRLLGQRCRRRLEARRQGQA